MKVSKEEKEEFDILVELGVLQREVKKVDRHIYNNYKRKIYKLEKKINKAIEYINYMFDKANENDIIDDLLKIEKILKGSEE